MENHSLRGTHSPSAVTGDHKMQISVHSLPIFYLKLICSILNIFQAQQHCEMEAVSILIFLNAKPEVTEELRNALKIMHPVSITHIPTRQPSFRSLITATEALQRGRKQKNRCLNQGEWNQAKGQEQQPTKQIARDNREEPKQWVTCHPREAIAKLASIQFCPTQVNADTVWEVINPTSDATLLLRAV